jgi:TatD DNase family protein
MNFRKSLRLELATENFQLVTFIMPFFDSHCHLQDKRLKDRINEVVGRAREAGVAHMLCCGTQESDWDAVIDLARRYHEIVPAFGLHPWFVGTRSAAWKERLETILKAHPDAPIGEIGLDHALDQRNDAEQAEVFVAQLKLARTLHRPVSMHCRRAWGEMVRILSQQYGFPDGGAIHSFSGSSDLIPQLEKLNVSVSFSGSITHDRNKKGTLAAAAVSPDRLLIETDSPDIPPSGIGEGQNEPALLPRVAQRLAEIRGSTAEKIAEQTYANAVRIFMPG